MEERKGIEDVKIAVANFIIRSTKEDAPSYAVQVLPEAIKSYKDLVVSRF